MIRFALGLVPPWGWAVLLAVGLASVTGWHLVQVHQARKDGRAEVYAKWDAEKAAALEAKREDERLRRQANQGVTDGFRNQARAAAAAASAARTELEQLHAELARRGEAGYPTAGPGADDHAAVAERALGECGSRYQALADGTGALAAQVAGLQKYAREVCLGQHPKGPTP